MASKEPKDGNKQKLAAARKKLREANKKLREAENLAGSNGGYERHKEDAAARSRAKSEKGREIGPLPPVKNPERRQAAMASLRVYCETYKKAKFYLEWSADQLIVIERLEQCARAGGQFALAMPRGSGKTELCKATIEWAILNGMHRFAMLIAAADKLAKRILRSIKRTFTTNPLLIDDFPEVCYPLKRLGNINQRAAGQTVNGEPTNIIWTDDEIRLPTVKGSACSGAVIQIAGLTGSFRGANEEGEDGSSMRVTLVLIDDPQTRGSAGSVTQTDDRADTIMGDIMGLVGPLDQLSAVMPCTVIYPGDLASQFTDRVQHPEWQGERMKMLNAFPTNMKLWQEYWDVRAEAMRRGGNAHGRKVGNEFYEANREAMDEGAEVAWKGRVKKGDLSALQSAMNQYLTDPRNFMAECQNEPKVEQKTGELVQLTEEDLAKKLNTLDTGVVPRDCDLLTAFVDVQQEILYWKVCAFNGRFGGASIAYGTYPEQPHDNFKAGSPPVKLSSLFPGKFAVYSGLSKLIPDLLGKGYRRDGSTSNMTVRLCLIDARYETQQIHDFIARSPLKALLHASMGRSVKAADRPMREYKVESGDRAGLNWIIEVKYRAKGLYVSFDANFWKNFVVDGFLTPAGAPDALYLYGDKIYHHRQLVHHLLSEYRIETAGRGRKLVEFKMRPGQTENHWLDGLAGCCLAASVCGLNPSPAGDPMPDDSNKPIRLSDLQKSNRNVQAKPPEDIAKDTDDKPPDDKPADQEKPAEPVFGTADEVKPIKLSDLQKSKRGNR